MTGQLGEQRAGRRGSDSAVLDRPRARALLGAAAVSGGMAVAWLASGSAALLAALAVLLAAGNGYGKAHSP